MELQMSHKFSLIITKPIRHSDKFGLLLAQPEDQLDQSIKGTPKYYNEVLPPNHYLFLTPPVSTASIFKKFFLSPFFDAHLSSITNWSPHHSLKSVTRKVQEGLVTSIDGLRAASAASLNGAFQWFSGQSGKRCLGRGHSSRHFYNGAFDQHPNRQWHFPVYTSSLFPNLWARFLAQAFPVSAYLTAFFNASLSLAEPRLLTAFFPMMSTRPTAFP